MSVHSLKPLFVWLGLIAVPPLFHLLTLQAAEPNATPAVAAVKRSEESFAVDGKKIVVQRYSPAEAGKHPAIIILHGADGRSLERFIHIYQNMAEDAARHGYVAFTVQYFDRTETKTADPATIIKEFGSWTEVVKESITYVDKQPDVDADRIGLEGVSLGSFLSLWTASQDERVKCVVEYFGGLPDALASQVKRMPPVLILHGEKDQLVKIEFAHHLEKLLKEKQVDYQIKLYPNQGHGFMGADSKDAGVRAIAFFDKYLKPAASAEKPAAGGAK